MIEGDRVHRVLDARTILYDHLEAYVLCFLREHLKNTDVNRVYNFLDLHICI